MVSNTSDYLFFQRPEAVCLGLVLKFSGVYYRPKETEYFIYPNPATNIVNIEVVNDENFGKLTMYDATGRQVKNEIMLGHKKSIDISDLENGFYIVDIEDDRDNIKLTFVKE